MSSILSHMILILFLFREVSCVALNPSFVCLPIFQLTHTSVLFYVFKPITNVTSSKCSRLSNKNHCINGIKIFAKSFLKVTSSQHIMSKNKHLHLSKTISFRERLCCHHFFTKIRISLLAFFLSSIRTFLQGQF